MSIRKFKQPAYPTVYFSTEIWVKCPRCSQSALVKTRLPKYIVPQLSSYSSHCVCQHCGFQIKENYHNIGHSGSYDEKIWQGYVQGFVNRTCGFCGTKICYATKPTNKTYKTANVECEICKKSQEYELQWYRYKNDKPNDPYFGFDLFLQTDIKGNCLWVYNLEHLEYLKNYVQADLREDDNRHKYSMITNLPQWVKSKKNRKQIVKKLERLSIMLNDKNN